MKVGYTTGIRGMEIRYGPWEDQVKPSGDHIPGNTVVNETFDPMYEPSLLLSYLTWAVKTICSRRLASLAYKFCLCEAIVAASKPPPPVNCPLHTLQTGAHVGLWLRCMQHEVGRVSHIRTQEWTCTNHM